jgi:hypothetical protein
MVPQTLGAETAWFRNQPKPNPLDTETTWATAMVAANDRPPLPWSRHIAHILRRFAKSSRTSAIFFYS